MFIAKLVTRNDDTGEKENILKTFNTLDELKETARKIYIDKEGNV